MSQRKTSFSAGKFDVAAPELAGILTYPRFSEQEYASRLEELRSLGITSLLTGGRTMLNGINIAGKGCVGLVIKAEAGQHVYALKIRRTDANRESVHEEVCLHRIANDAGVGPRLVRHTDNFILMEFIDGQNIAEWASGPVTADQIRAVARSVLEQCYNLDRAGLDHGELSKIDNHVIVSGSTAAIIDFESASTKRKTSNVSAAGQSLFVSGAVATMINRVLPCDKELAIRALRTYKRDQTRANFDALISLLA